MRVGRRREEREREGELLGSVEVVCEGPLEVLSL
jgi:hypothetical protein